MSEIGETYGALRAESQAKRSDNRQSSAGILRSRSFEFETKNLGAHLIVRHRGVIVDFWPGTGLWCPRGGRRGRGVFKLIRFLSRLPERTTP